ncbi:MAG TPA: cation:proton antiporter [Stellaceae bacterium]|nr:cation:proton antiporter [Stellaceae bacterium]
MHAAPMEGAPSLVATVVVSLTLAYLGGMLARAARLPPLLGYLLAGVVVGPFTPGFVADQRVVEELAEIGVALLLFGVGLHFSLGDLVAVWRVAVPGSLLQIAISAGLSFGVGRFIGFGASESALLAICLATPSTVVATRTLQDRDQLRSATGRVALGWLVMQDLLVVGVLIMLPGSVTGFAAQYGAAAELAFKLLEVLVFVAGMLLLGRWLIPWVLARTAHEGTQELFRLSVLVAALGIAYLSSALIGVSLALGAFFAGVVIADSDVSHQAAGESVPVQQLFTVLFFVSVGMLFDPTIFLHAPLHIAAVVAAVALGIWLVTAVVLLLLRAAPRGALEVAAALAQIGEFSFILSGVGVAQGLLPTHGRDLVLAAALISILLQPAVFRAARAAGARLEKIAFLRRWHSRRRGTRPQGDQEPLERHAIIVGHGRVGSVIAARLRQQGIPYIVIEQSLRAARLLRREGIPVVYGDAAWPEVLDAAHPERARLLVIAVPERSAARRILTAARRVNPGIELVVRTHSHEEADWLARHEVGLAVMGEQHAADEMARYVLKRFAR